MRGEAKEQAEAAAGEEEERQVEQRKERDWGLRGEFAGNADFGERE